MKPLPAYNEMPPPTTIPRGCPGSCCDNEPTANGGDITSGVVYVSSTHGVFCAFISPNDPGNPEEWPGPL